MIRSFIASGIITAGVFAAGVFAAAALSATAAPADPPPGMPASAAPAAAGTGTPEAPKPAAPKTAVASPDTDMVCITEQSTGSRLGAKRTCMTRAQFKARSVAGQEALEELRKDRGFTPK